jgi:hypothetical protein
MRLDALKHVMMVTYQVADFITVSLHAEMALMTWTLHSTTALGTGVSAIAICVRVG